MNTRTAWILYTLLRLVFFAVPFAGIFFLLTGNGIPQLIAALAAAIVAALIAVSLSVIFLAKPRETAAQSIYDWRHRDRTADDVVEDDAVDGSAPTADRTAPKPGED